MILPPETEPVVDADRKLTDPWRVALQEAGVLEGYGAPVGSVSRASFTTYSAPVAAGAYSQAQMQVVMAQLQAMSQTLAALITDLRSAG